MTKLCFQFSRNGNMNKIQIAHFTKKKFEKYVQLRSRRACDFMLLFTVNQIALYSLFAIHTEQF